MTEKQFLHNVIEKDMPDMEKVRRDCLAIGEGNANPGWNQKKLPVRKLAAAACIVAALCVGSGINYAATGTTPLELFHHIFKDSDAEVGVQITESFNTEKQVIISRELNIQYILQSYWYDRESGTLLTQTEVSTLDGSPLVSWEDIYANGDGVNDDISQWYKDAKDLQSKFEAGEEYAFSIYENAVNTYMEDNLIVMEENYYSAVGTGEQSVESDSAVRFYTIWYNIHDAKGELYDEIVLRPQFACDDPDAKFVLSDTGSMNEREIDISAIPNCIDAQLTGAYMTFSFESAASDPTKDCVQQLEITMKDGTVFRGRGSSSRADEELGYEEAAEQNICYIPMNWTVNSNDGTKYISAAFDQFIDVDNIVSVVINGQECLTD